MVKHRLTWLDTTRGIAVLMVLCAHTLDLFSREYSRFMQIGNAGVMLFFICSGYVIPMSLEKSSLGDFWIRRFFRLYPAYWLAIVLMIPLGMSQVTTWQEVLINFTMVHAFLGVNDVNPIFWSLTVEMMFYMAMTLLVLLRVHTKTFTLFLAMMALTLTMQFMQVPYDYRWLYLPIFFLGTLYYRYDTGCCSRPVLIAATLLAATYLACWPTGWNWRSGWLFALSIFLLIHLHRNRSWPVWLVWCGVVSYSIYLLHGIPLTLSGGVGIPLVFLLAALSYYAIERPSITLGRCFTSLPLLNKQAQEQTFSS